MTYHYQKFDNIFDIESLKNLFLDSHYFVQQHRIEIFYLTRVNHHTNLNHHLRSGQTVANYIRRKIINQIPGFKADQQLTIHFYNLMNFSNVKRYLTLFGVAPNAPTALGNINSQGMVMPPDKNALRRYHDGQSIKLWHHTHPVNITTYNHALQTEDSRFTHLPHVYNLISQYYPVKVTDPQFNPHYYGSGIMIGYNSNNYDLTMIAHFITQLIQFPGIVQALNQDRQLWPAHLSSKNFRRLMWLLNPRSLRQFNDHLFYLTCTGIPMPDALIRQNSPHRFIERLQSTAWYIRKGWLQTNRYLDILHLNRRISLKRIEAMTGMQINESVNVSQENDRLENYRQLADFITYNINDINATRKAFEMPVYQDALQLRKLLLKKFPALIYSYNYHRVNHKTATPQDVLIAPDNLRFTRLTDDSSSAQFIINTIAPYHALKDIPGIDYSYPDPRVLRILRKKYPKRHLPKHPVNILDETMKWAQKQDRRYQTGGAIARQLMPIYNTYKDLEYHNVNLDLCVTYVDRHQHRHYQSIHGILRDPRGRKRLIGPYAKLRDELHRYNMNIPYIKKNGLPSSCIVAFGIGGIHGLEIRQNRLRHEIHHYRQLIRRQGLMKQIFGTGTQGAAAAKWKQNINLHGQLVNVTPYLKTGSTAKHAEWRKLTPPTIYHYDLRSGRYSIKNSYNYISVGSCQHEDFSGYYPLLISRMGAFWPHNEKNDIYRQLYLERLHLKAQLKRFPKNSPQWKRINLQQKLRKLLLNSASGAGSANFTNHLRMNNRIVSMRIIGQLFAWRIGEAETLAGGRVPSTNTDGMYVMDLPAKVNNRVLLKNVKAMMLNITPAPLARFVSKDANNRVEVELHHNRPVLTEAKGGTLTSWQGPGPTNNLSHPAVVDWLLAHYLAYYPGNPSNHPFNSQWAFKQLRQLRQQLLNPQKYFKTLKMFQWVTAVSRWKHRFIFTQNFKQLHHRQKLTGFRKLKTINRIFLIKPSSINHYLKIAKINHAQWNRFNNDPTYHNQLVQLVESGRPTPYGKIIKYPDMPNHQNTVVDGHNLKYWSLKKRKVLYQQLDLRGYLRIIQTKFASSWSNLSHS